MRKTSRQRRQESVVQRLQGALARLNDVPIGPDVSDFLLTSREQARALGGDAALDEQVFVSRVEDALNVSVYIDADVLDRLAAADPERVLDECNLQDFCTALEGV